MYTQFVVPALAGVAYFGLLKPSVAAPLYRRNPTLGFVGNYVNIFRWYCFCCSRKHFLAQFESILSEKITRARKNS